MTANRIAERSRSIESAAAAGLVFAVASIVSWFLLQLPPDLSAPDAEISAWYEDPGNLQAVIIGLTLAVISAMAFLWFVAVDSGVGPIDMVHEAVVLLRSSAH